MKAFEKGCFVDECTEEYTSQTCGKCGALNKIGSSEIYKCEIEKCGFTMDRDVNGARNIAIKRLNRL
jgi:putative transposase